MGEMRYTCNCQICIFNCYLTSPLRHITLSHIQPAPNGKLHRTPKPPLWPPLSVTRAAIQQVSLARSLRDILLLHNLQGKFFMNSYQVDFQNTRISHFSTLQWPYPMSRCHHFFRTTWEPSHCSLCIYPCPFTYFDPVSIQQQRFSSLNVLVDQATYSWKTLQHPLLHFRYYPNTVSPLHTNLQVSEFQRCKHACQGLYASCCTVLP